MTGRIRARDHQHPGPEPRQYFRKLLRPPGTGHDAAGGGELEVRHGHGGPVAQRSAPSGNTAENRVDCRGSAIISATVSRQVT